MVMVDNIHVTVPYNGSRSRDAQKTNKKEEVMTTP